MIFKKASSSFSLLFSCFILDFFFFLPQEEMNTKWKSEMRNGGDWAGGLRRRLMTGDDL